jgi:hypothetical protein
MEWLRVASTRCRNGRATFVTCKCSSSSGQLWVRSTWPVVGCAKSPLQSVQRVRCRLCKESVAGCAKSPLQAVHCVRCTWSFVGSPTYIESERGTRLVEEYSLIPRPSPILYRVRKNKNVPQGILPLFWPSWIDFGKVGVLANLRGNLASVRSRRVARSSELM